MPSDELIRNLCLADVGLALVLIYIMRRARELSTFWPLAVTLLSSTIPEVFLLTLRWVHSYHVGPSARLAYDLYFWTYWSLYFIGSAAALVAIYKIFNTAMRPLKGLQDLGRIVFYWVAGISVALGISGSLLPHDSSRELVLSVVIQLVRASSILVASLMLFVCFCIKPLGLTLRSRVFGVSLGLTIVSMANLIVAAHLGGTKVLYTAFSVAQFILQFSAELIWIYYFAVPEPVRKFILLPTTSPFHKWNQISELLGHEPGFVAIGGIAPEVFASAEIEIFHRASAKMPKLAVPTVPQPVSPEEWLRSGDK